MTYDWWCWRPSYVHSRLSGRSTSSITSARQRATCAMSGCASPPPQAASASGRHTSSPCSHTRQASRADTTSSSPCYRSSRPSCSPVWAFGIASVNRVPAGRWIGGATVGGGIAAMHYTGMAAFEIAGRIQWDPVLVVASIVLGAAIGATALPAGLRDGSMKWKAIGAVLLTLAICSHHFTAMGAVSIIPDPTVVVSQMALATGWLALGVALASLTILFLACAGLALDIRERHRAELEVDRMRGPCRCVGRGVAGLLRRQDCFDQFELDGTDGLCP